MKVSFPTFVALSAVCAFGVTSAKAEEYYGSAYDNDVATASATDLVSQDEVDEAQTVVANGGPTTMFMPSLTSMPGWQLETEVLFLRFHKATGTQVNNTLGPLGPDPDLRGIGSYQTGFEASPRISISYVASNNMFAKVRWFDYQHSAKNIIDGPDVNNGSFGGASIDAYSLDFVAGERFYLARGWDIEVEGGLRHIGYEEHRRDVITPNDTILRILHDVSWGTGPIVGLEARKQVRSNASVFGRFRTAIVQGGHRHWPQNNVAGGRFHNNMTSMHIELATGSEWNWILDCGSEIFVRVTGEAIQWSDLSTDDGNQGDLSDIGWGGFGFVFGIYN